MGAEPDVKLSLMKVKGIPHFIHIGSWVIFISRDMFIAKFATIEVTCKKMSY